jgi:hypothetical protein
MNEIYRRILQVPGVVMEFGSLWGRRLAVFMALRELYEPYDYTRKVIGFDTFSGFPAIHEKDGRHPEIHPGSMSLPDGYEQHLRDVLEAHESDSALAHIHRFDLRRGDVQHTLPEYFAQHPETIISLAYFDLDLYEPTKTCLELIRPRLVPGSILAFDELVHPNFPGETQALLDILDLSQVTLQKLPFCRYPTFLTI